MWFVGLQIYDDMHDEWQLIIVVKSRRAADLYNMRYAASVCSTSSSGARYSVWRAPSAFVSSKISHQLTCIPQNLSYGGLVIFKTNVDGTTTIKSDTCKHLHFSACHAPCSGWITFWRVSSFYFQLYSCQLNTHVVYVFFLWSNAPKLHAILLWATCRVCGKRPNSAGGRAAMMATSQTTLSKLGTWDSLMEEYSREHSSQCTHWFDELISRFTCTSMHVIGSGAMHFSYIYTMAGLCRHDYMCSEMFSIQMSMNSKTNRAGGIRLSPSRYKQLEVFIIHVSA